MFTFSRYERTRFWAVYENETLLCVAVYQKGALAIIERITGIRPERPKRNGKFRPTSRTPQSPPRTHTLKR